MNLSIRKAVCNNLSSESTNELIKTINESVGQKDEAVLPGLGVMFEVLWTNCDNEEKLTLANTISKNMNQYSK